MNDDLGTDEYQHAGLVAISQARPVTGVVGPSMQHVQSEFRGVFLSNPGGHSYFRNVIS